VWHELVESGTVDDCPPEITAALRGASQARALEADLMNRELTRVLEAAGQAGIPLVITKGAAVSHTHYPRPHLRPRGDSDLVIRPDDRNRLAAVLQSCGYVPSAGVDGSLVTQQRQWVRRVGPELAFSLDVHWRVFNPRVFANVLSPEDLIARAVPVPVLGDSARAPHPIHALLLACVHRVAHHRGDEDLLWLYDIRLLAESLSDGGAAEFIALATERRVAAVCADGLVRAVRVVDARLPAPLRSWIEYAPWRDAGEPSAAFLDHDRQVDKLVSDLRALPTLSMRARLVWQHLFPRPEYMLRHYSVRSRVWLPYLYLKRIVAGAPRWLHR
jgi:hypothetical protein